MGVTGDAYRPASQDFYATSRHRRDQLLENTGARLKREELEPEVHVRHEERRQHASATPSSDAASIDGMRVQLTSALFATPPKNRS